MSLKHSALKWHLLKLTWKSIKRYLLKFVFCLTNFFVFKIADRLTDGGVLWKKVSLKNFAKFAGKHLFRRLFFNRVAGLRCFSDIKLSKNVFDGKIVLENFVKFTEEHLQHSYLFYEVADSATVTFFFFSFKFFSF